jgi:hypothetical protein
VEMHNREMLSAVFHIPNPTARRRRIRKEERDEFRKEDAEELVEEGEQNKRSEWTMETEKRDSKRKKTDFNEKETNQRRERNSKQENKQ